MSGDETFVLLVCLGLAFFLWGRWMFLGSQLYQPKGKKYGGGLNWATLLCLAIIFTVLKLFASFDVRDSSTYLFFYTVMGLAWLWLAQLLFPWVDLIIREDILERSNPAAAYAAWGAFIGLALCFSGANIGDGPGWWVVVFCAGLASLVLFVLWAIYAKSTRLMDAITIDRDAAAGIRLAGYLIGCSLILGRAAAGNWVSSAEAVISFLKLGWPAFFLLVLALLSESFLRKALRKSQSRIFVQGILPGMVHCGLGSSLVVLHGWWT